MIINVKRKNISVFQKMYQWYWYKILQKFIKILSFHGDIHMFDVHNSVRLWVTGNILLLEVPGVPRRQRSDTSKTLVFKSVQNYSGLFTSPPPKKTHYWGNNTPLKPSRQNLDKFACAMLNHHAVFSIWSDAIVISQPYYQHYHAIEWDHINQRIGDASHHPLTLTVHILRQKSPHLTVYQSTYFIIDIRDISQTDYPHDEKAYVCGKNKPFKPTYAET